MAESRDQRADKSLRGLNQPVLLASMVAALIVLTLSVAKCLAIGYTAHFVGIVLAMVYAEPSIPETVGSLIFVGALNVAAATPRLQWAGLLIAIDRSGLPETVQAALTPARRWLLLPLVCLYFATPFAFGALAAANQQEFGVLTFSRPPQRSWLTHEALIIGPSQRGYLAAMYDRSKNALMAGETYDDTLAPGDPTTYRTERISNLLIERAKSL